MIVERLAATVAAEDHPDGQAAAADPGARHADAQILAAVDAEPAVPRRPRSTRGPTAPGLEDAEVARVAAVAEGQDVAMDRGVVDDRRPADPVSVGEHRHRSRPAGAPGRRCWSAGEVLVGPIRLRPVVGRRDANSGPSPALWQNS